MTILAEKGEQVSRKMEKVENAIIKLYFCGLSLLIYLLDDLFSTDSWRQDIFVPDTRGLMIGWIVTSLQIRVLKS